MTDLLFGHGSLTAEGGRPAVLHGFERRWGVAMDNRRTIPGYKLYLDPAGLRPAVWVAYLDIHERAEAAVEGFVIPVDAERLAALDRRERSYDRIEVTGRVEGAPGRVWAYRGSDAGRARLATGVEAGAVVVAAAYLETVRRGFAEAGLEPPRDLHPPFPVAELRRVDLPPPG